VLAPDGNTSLHVLDVASGVHRPLVDSPAHESFGVVSPNEQWLAYQSDVTGQPEIYVETFPRTGQWWRISTEGGLQPRWHPKGRELFYLAPDRRLMSTQVGAATTAFEWEAPRALFQTAIVDVGAYWGSQTYAVAPDGRFLVLTLRSQGSSPAVAMMNWTSHLSEKRPVP